MPQIDLKPKLTRLNLDDSYYHLGKEDYVGALNITHNAQEQSEDIISTNVTGNRLVPFTFHDEGERDTVGAKEDILRNRVFEFVWLESGYHCIIIYDNASRTRTKLIENLTDTNDIDVLQFTQSNKIIHVDIIYRGEDEGDLVFYTDGNVTPRKFNVKHIQDGNYTYIQIPFIELAKMPPKVPVQAVYGTDSTRNANSLRKKLIMATYRWSYDDFEKSTFTTYSKIPLPIGYYGSDNDIDSTKNNFITFTVETGNENVTDIEIAVRFNVGENWEDFVLAISLNKEQLGIVDNTTYQYLFYNDAIYPPFEGGVEEVTQLFDWVPKKAKSQCCGNGNTIELAAITEGYGNYPTSQLDVTITAENQTNVPPDTDPLQLTYTSTPFMGGTMLYTFTVAGNVVTGTLIRVRYLLSTTPGILVEYTTIGGDTDDDVATGLFTYLSVNHPAYAGSNTANQFTAIIPNAAIITSVEVDIPAPGGGTISTEKTWLWDANYIFGLAYKDEQGRIMPGVTTFVNPVDSDNDFLVTTDSFSLDTGDVQTPVISSSINHIPPVDAVTYAWVRRRMTYANFLMYETCDYQDPTDGYLYFCLANIEKYKIDNSQFIYGTAPITPTSRIKVIAGITAGAYDGDIWNQDYEIIGQVTKTLTGGSSPDDDRFFIKVVKPSGSISPSYKVNMLVMVYTPMTNPTDIADSVYWEWGEEYDIYEGTTLTYNTLSGVFNINDRIADLTSGASAVLVSDNGSNEMTISDLEFGSFNVGDLITGTNSGATARIVTVVTQNYHRGLDQDQTGTQAAEFTWTEGDVYFHQRNMYSNLLTLDSDTLNIMDANWSDFFASAVNDNGRGLTIEVNARETFFPATIRFSREYQQNTNINQTNRFIYTNFIDLDRSFGSILKMSIRDRYIRIGQQFKIGSVPIFNQISKDQAGSTLVAATDVLLNPVTYYLGDYGVGDAPEAWTDFNFSSYFFDTNRNIWCRLSRDGIIPISVQNKINSWATSEGSMRGNDSKIYGTLDSKSNNCIFAFEEVNIYASVGNLQAFVVSVSLNDNVYLYGGIAANILVTLSLTATNSDAQTVTYTTVENETTISLRNNLISLLNSAAGTLFHGVTVTVTTPTLGVSGIPNGTHLFGLRVSNLAGFGVTSTVTFEGNLIQHIDAYTLAFAEDNNAYESFLSYHPEMMCTLGALLITWKDGQLWTHDGTVYNNFYGVQYPSYVTPVFNDQSAVKKKYLGIGYKSLNNTIWASPENGDVITSFVNPQTGLSQISQLKEVDYELEETTLCAALNNDANSMADAREAVANGDPLQGNYIAIKLICPATKTGELVNLSQPYLTWIPSGRNF